MTDEVYMLRLATMLHNLRSTFNDFLWEIEWADLYLLLAAVQLALTHPEMPALTKQRLTELVEGVIGAILEIDPGCEDVLRSGRWNQKPK